MKIGGIDPRTLPTEEVLVLPRGDNRIVFRARGLESMDEFNKLSPEPKAPGKLTRDGWVPDTADEGYQSVMAEFSKRRTGYYMVHSLEPSEIEWDTVQADNPSTWCNWEDDLRGAGLSRIEINRVSALVLEANCLDEAKLRKAREVFLQGPPQGPAV